MARQNVTRWFRSTINEEKPMNQNECKTNSSPKSTNSSTNGSLDSGQCSGSIDTSPPVDKHFGSRLSKASTQKKGWHSEELPSYARVASTLDSILRSTSAIYCLLEADIQNPKISKDLFDKVESIISLLRQLPDAEQFAHSVWMCLYLHTCKEKL